MSIDSLPCPWGVGDVLVQHFSYWYRIRIAGDSVGYCAIEEEDTHTTETPRNNSPGLLGWILNGTVLERKIGVVTCLAVLNRDCRD